MKGSLKNIGAQELLCAYVVLNISQFFAILAK